MNKNKLSGTLDQKDFKLIANEHIRVKQDDKEVKTLKPFVRFEHPKSLNQFVMKDLEMSSL